MNENDSIITTRELYLGDRFEGIRDKIENPDNNKKYLKYQELGDICKFYPDKNRLEYNTERIYPNASNHRDRIPILFLFSNPHPVSVKTGLFLSEPRSRKFWVRLFESKHLTPLNTGIDLERWNRSTPSTLGNLMLEGIYNSNFAIYFHCLYPIPTRQLQDLYSLFGKRTELWKQIERNSIAELALLLKKESINHVIIFTSPVFQLLTDAKKESVGGWRRKVIDAIKNGNVKQLWAQNGPGKANAKDKEHFSENANFYHTLDTHVKDWGKGMDQRYFTLSLDSIFSAIRKENSVF